MSRARISASRPEAWSGFLIIGKFQIASEATRSAVLVISSSRRLLVSVPLLVNMRVAMRRGAMPIRAVTEIEGIVVAAATIPIISTPPALVIPEIIPVPLDRTRVGYISHT